MNTETGLPSWPSQWPQRIGLKAKPMERADWEALPSTVHVKPIPWDYSLQGCQVTTL